MQQLNHIVLQDDSCLVLDFNHQWYQDDLTQLINVFFLSFQLLTKVEHIHGADCECVRFTYCDLSFILNFECYTRSCWIEAESHVDQLLMSDLLAYLQCNNA